MDIDKIQFGQLSAGKIDKSFEDLDVNGDGKINEQDENLATNLEIKNAISQILASDVDEEPELDDDSNFDIDNLSEIAGTRHAELGSASQDSEIPKQVRNDVSNNTPALQAQLTTLSLQAQKLQKEQEDLQDELETKQNEQQKIEKQILAKQEEYEALAKEIENSQEKDPNKVALAEQLASEIKTLTTDFDNLKSEITEIQGKYQSNSTQLQMLTTQIQSLQSQTTQSVSQPNTVNNVAEVSEVSDVAEVNEATPTNATTPTQKAEYKTMDEYCADLKCRFEQAYEKCGGDLNTLLQYVKDNPMKFSDIDGDGRITLLDKAIYKKFQSDKTLPNLDGEKTSKGEGRRIISSIAQRVNINMQAVTTNSEKLDLDDLENLYKLTGGNLTGITGGISKSMINMNIIATQENWEERFEKIATDFKIPITTKNGLTKQLKDMAEYAKNHPETAQYAGLASGFQNYLWKISHMPNESEYSCHEAYMSVLSRICGCSDIVRIYGDMNHDGTIDAKDLANFSTDVDLDGDGKVSAEEKSYLTQVKKDMERVARYNDNRKGAQNLNTIDDVIGVLENNDKSFDDVRSSILYYEDGTLTTSGAWMEKFKESGGQQWPIRRSPVLYGITNAFTGGTGTIVINGYLDGTKTFDINRSTTFDYDTFMNSFLPKVFEVTKPKNTYLHYVMNADLTKGELQEILSKINSASISVQSQLVEVKSVVEQRIASM